jgi:hypothetical protein
MRWRVSASGELDQRLVIGSKIALMILLMSVGTAYAEKPQGAPSETIDPVAELFYLDTIDALTVDLEACQEMLELKEDPPECERSFPWLVVVVAVAAGYVAKDLLD